MFIVFDKDRRASLGAEAGAFREAKIAADPKPGTADVLVILSSDEDPSGT